MLKQFTRALFAMVALTLSQHAAFAADYTVHDVYQAAEAGHLQEAQSMMQQVLRNHPESAKAHYVEAELYAKSGQFDYARRELKTAKRLDPTLGFAKQDAVESLQSRLDAVPSSGSLSSKSGYHWGYWLLGVGLIAVIVIAMRALMRRNAAPVATSYGPSTTYGPGYGPTGGGPMGGPISGMSSGMGGSILGGLATGAAVGVGIVAGEALANRFMDGGRSSERVDTERVDATPPATDWDNKLGGNDFGLNDNSSWDDGSAGGDMGGDWG